MALQPAVALSLLAGLGLPALIIFVTSRGGWSELAQSYPGQGSSPEPKTRFGYGSLRGFIGYKGALIVASDVRGLHLATWPVLLSWCHGPVFIPWAEVTEVRSRQGFGGSTWEIVTRRAPHLRLALRGGTFALVRDDARLAGVRGADRG